MTNTKIKIGQPRGRRALAIFALIFLTQSATAQSEYEKSRNLTTCLDGRYPSLCKKQWLTEAEVSSADSAVRRANLSNCLDGRYPSLCKKGLLQGSELAQVQAAEKRENLKNCLDGRYPSLCKKGLLESAELTQVQAAESRANQSRKQYESSAGTRTRRSSSSGCESGHWVDSVSSDGDIVKLEDGSIWEVDAVDAIDSALWLPTTDIVACDDKLINTEDNETVSARRIR